jgi:hypothetical protein
MNDPESTTRPRFSGWFSILIGVLLSVFAAVPAAIITAIFYRFPVMLVGYISIPEFLGSKGISETARALPGLLKGISWTVFFCGIRGWYIFLALVGGVGGWIVHQSGVANYRASLCWNLTIACIAGMIFALFIASFGIH